MKKLTIISAAIILAACSVKLIPPTQADVDRVQPKYPNYTLADLNQGKVLFEQHCNACHNYKKPTSRSEFAWEKIIPKMVKNVNKKEGAKVIDSTGQDLILKYVVTMSDHKK